MNKLIFSFFLLATNIFAQSMTTGNASYGYLSGNAVYPNHTYTFGVNGVSTSWTTGTTFSVTGGSGASIISQTVPMFSQIGKIELQTGTATGTLTITDSVDSASITLSVVNTPTISNISVSNDTNEIVVKYTVAPDSFCQVQYGVTSQHYIWSSYDFPSGNWGSNGSVAAVAGKCSAPIPGLADGTTYYVLPTARPNADDETNGCMTAVQGCGTSEQSIATLPASASHVPALPTSMAPSLFIEPNTTGIDATDTACSPNCYVTVNLTSTLDAECAASATYNAPPGYSSSTINSGDTLTTIMANPVTKLWHGTIFTYPEGTFCPVPNSDGNGAGYAFPTLPIDPIVASSSDSRCTSIAAVDSPCNRWVVFHTLPTNASDFPPLGVRIGPSFFPKLGGFQTSNWSNTNVFDARGTIFYCEGACTLDHLWVENSEFRTDPAVSHNFDVFFIFGDPVSNQTVFPQYIVLSRNYFHSPVRVSISDETPSVQGVLLSEFTPDMQYAIVGNYTDGWYFNSGAGIPQPFYFTDCGFFSTICGWGDHILIDNNYIEGMGMSIYGEVNNGTNPSTTDITVTHNYLYYSPATLPFAQSIGFGSCRNQIEFKGGMRVNISGNYINGQWACENTGNPILTSRNSDLTIKSNYITNVASGINVSGQIISRSLAQASLANRVLVTNNLLYNLGRGNFNAGGGGLATAGIELNASPINLTITNNTFGPITTNNGSTLGWWYAYLIVDEGGGPIANLKVQKNVFPFALGQTAYSGGIGANNGFTSVSHFATPFLANSSLINGVVNFAGALASFAGAADGSAGAGMTAAETIAGGTGYSNGSLSFGSACTGTIGAYTVNGSAVQSATMSNFGTCDPNSVDFTVSAGSGGALLRPQYGLNPIFTWNNNVNYCTTYSTVGEMGNHPTNARWQANHSYSIGDAIFDVTAYNQTQQVTTAGTSGGSTPSWNDGGGNTTDGSVVWHDVGVDLCAYTTQTMPPNDTYPTGVDTATRQAAAGLASNYSIIPTTFNSGNAGANLNTIYTDTGTVTYITTATSAGSIMISYTAPDTHACSVDTSPDAVTWTRASDGGGIPQRSVSVNSLSASTTYNYRVLCYFEQISPLFTGSQITNGTVTTLASGTQNITVPCAISNFSGTTSCVATLTAINTTPYTCTSTGDSCNITGIPLGDYKWKNVWNNGNKTDFQVFRVR